MIIGIIWTFVFKRKDGNYLTNLDTFRIPNKYTMF